MLATDGWQPLRMNADIVKNGSMKELHKMRAGMRAGRMKPKAELSHCNLLTKFRRNDLYSGTFEGAKTAEEGSQN